MKRMGLTLVALVTLPALASCGDGNVTTANTSGTGGTGNGTGGETTTGGTGGGAGENGEATTTGGTGGTGNGTGGTGGTVPIPAGLGVGEDCSKDDCRPGLSCEDDVCELAGSTGQGDPCIASGECEDGLVCLGQLCLPGGDGEAGDGCTSDADCGTGLRCNLVGFGASCQPEGSGDVGGDCALAAECLGGLTCAGQACTPIPPGLPGFGIPTWDGVECEEPTDGTVRAYFEIPGAEDAEEGDFFRLPFPNDARLKNGSPDLSGFPTPGAGLLGVDPVQIYVDRVEEERSGWSPNSMVLFRFSGRIDHDSFTNDDARDEGRLRFLDVTPGLDDSELDNNAGWRAYYTTGRSQYVCNNWMGFARYSGRPLMEGHTYAAILTTGGTDENGDPIERSENLEALLSDDPPSDSALDDAYDAYEPLRDYLALDTSDEPWPDLNASMVLNATVITVDDYTTPMADLADAVSDAPETSDWVLCDDDVESPCPDATGDRACGSRGGDFDEYHALVTLPIFQQGDAPYLTEGGDIDVDNPSEEQVCLSLTVPTGSSMPQAGWPLVIFAHGTGGSFRSHVRDEVAGALATASEPFAVMGIDQVEHGPRRGDSTESPNNLFFNFLNPDAALGNPMQGAADQLSLLQLAKNLDLDADTTGGDAILIDPNRVEFFGHSQGSTHGSLMLPFADIPGAVLSGNGGHLRLSLLSKTQPVNIAAALPFVLQEDVTSEGTLEMGEWHPVLGLLQQYIDPADPVNFAGLAAANPPEGQQPHSIFETFGIDDSYAPPPTLFAYAIAARAALAPHPSGVNPDEDNSDPRMPEESDPVSGNITVDTTDVTVAMRQYEPPNGADGHFVVFDVNAANQDAVDFLTSLSLGEVPTVGD